MRTLLSAGLAAAFLSAPNVAAQTCGSLFAQESGQSKAVRSIVVPDAYKQWLLWEQTANVEQFRKPTTPINVGLVKMSAENVTVKSTIEAPEELLNQFRAPDGDIYWAQHPYNTSPVVPFKDLPAVAQLPAYMTASRSLALDGELRGFTIKLGTNYPHGPNGERQEGKTKTNDDIDSALIHTTHMKTNDLALGPDEKVLTLGEIMTMAEKKTGIGMVVRDVRLLNDGHYYLPALSIPYVGREIAKVNGARFEDFFQTYYAELLGEAKARLLLRYGLQMLTPNSQNMLIQFDRNLKPTGKIVFRDVSDAYLVEAAATGLGFEEQIKLDNAVEYPPKKEIMPYWSNSSWRFDEAGDKSVTDLTLAKWGTAHNRAYIEYLEKELGVALPYTNMMIGQDEFPSIYKFLASDIGQQKLKQYRARAIKAEKNRQRDAAKARQAS